MQDILANFVNWLVASFQIFANPPYAVILIVLVSATVSTLSNLSMRRFSDMRRLSRYQTEIKQYQEMSKEAEKTQNAKLLKKVKRRKAYIDRIQRETMTQRCKPTLMFFIPFMLVFYMLQNFYFDPVSGTNRVVAILPFNVQKLLPFLQGLAGYPMGVGFGMTFLGFYFLVGLGLSSILQRIMGTQIMTAP